MEGIDQAGSKALTMINLDCFYLCYCCLFFGVKVFTRKLPVNV